ncbi:hypothetical protein [Terriglobus albidus]|uniref:hypothetical protein n=1 Tax=Terriglobus albidus TaxID=1592106 RepID=UPI0021E0B7D8|nr:hypothetical protein [Terriglobus albidus]
MKPIACLTSALLLSATLLAEEPAVRVAPPQLQGSRPLEQQTESSVIRNYLESWKSLQEALDHNQAGKLDRDFVGVARDKLGDTVEAQSRMGIHTHYQDLSHDLQIVFYSPEGLSIQMTDNVEYRQQIFEKDKLLATTVVRRRYLVVLTPSEVRWQVRILQAGLD